MTAPFERVEAVFARVVDLEPGAAEAMLRDLENSEPTVAAEVRDLLAAHRELTESDFLDAPATALLSSFAEEEDSGPAEGDSIGRYRVEARIGSGGMGQVYRAHDPRLDRTVAIKVLSPWMAADDGAVRRFVREARAASGLDHPHIATVHEVDTTARGRPYIVMAHHPGPTLEAHLAERGALDVASARRIGAEIAGALAAAHAAGIVHRDVKPANVLLTPRGVRVVDFGIAWSDAAGLTRTLLAAGTLPYMSPEQTRGSEAAASTDVWSLGVVLYEMLAGRRPFRGRDEALVQQIRADDPEPAGALRPDLPPDLVDLVSRCLDRDPTRRPSASSVAAALGAEPGSPPSLGAEPGSPPSFGRGREGRRRSRGWAGVAGAVVLAAAVAGVMRFTPADAGPEARSVALLPFEPLDGDEAEVYTRGIQDDLQTRLSGVPGLQVTSPATAEALVARGASAGAADELGVRWVVEGSVGTLGDQLRVNVRLVDPIRGRQQWGRSYLRALTPEGLFTVEEEILSDLASRLGVPATAAASGGAPPDDLGSYRLYVEGRTYLARRTEVGLRRAVDAFQAALAQSPDFAPAWAGLADALVIQGAYGYGERAELLPRARDAAERALAIRPDLAEAHASLGLVIESLDHDGPAALEAYRRATALQPSYLAAHQWTAGLLISLGRLAEARAPLQRAIALDPASPSTRVALARWYQYSDSLGPALEHTRAALNVEPGMPSATMLQGELLREAGRLDEARQMLERALELPGINPAGFPGVWVELSIVHRTLGDSLRAHQLLEALGSPLHPFVEASVQTSLGDTDRALTLLESIPPVLDFSHIIRYHPVFDGLRGDPRMGRILDAYDSAWGLPAAPRGVGGDQDEGQDTAGL
ncbi:protein kinase domain-containing protein [Gaopeijia maritima]|uniref:Protein kinase n=1 Tax=Gaopeijia maritima TaxID=3119007 RepID=A0ABU9E627_9BACT